MSGEVNLFLHQCVTCGSLPFAVEMSQYFQQTLDSMAEARRISRDHDINGYDSMKELKAPLDECLLAEYYISNKGKFLVAGNTVNKSGKDRVIWLLH